MPGYSQEKSAVNDAFNIMRNAAFQREHLTSRELYSAFGCIEPDSPVQSLH